MIDSAKRPFIVHTLWPYTNRSAGIRALFTLAHDLQERGHPVFLSPTRIHKFVNDPWPWERQIATLSRFRPSEEFVHVWPEMELSRDMAGTNVRWLLGPHSIELAGELYDDDLIVTWSRRWAHHSDDPLLRVDVLERELFCEPPAGTVRSGVLTYGATASFSGPVITSTWPETRSELANLLQHAGQLLCYKPESIIVEEARLCGCKVTLVDTHNIGWEEDRYDPELFAGELDNLLYRISSGKG